MAYQEIQAGLKGYGVTRYHTRPTLLSQTVADHSAGVALIVLVLTGGVASRSLIHHALIHDIGEYAAGDMPAPVKRSATEEARMHFAKVEKDYLQALGEENLPMPLTATEKDILKAADVLELCFKSQKEILLGNLSMVEVMTNGYEYLTALYLPGRVAQRALECIVGILASLPRHWPPGYGPTISRLEEATTRLQEKWSIGT